MKNFIGHIHDTRKLTSLQLDSIKEKIKTMLHLDTVEIGQSNGGLYPVSTDDGNIVDFKIDNYNNDTVSLVKYLTYNDEMQRDPYGATLTSADIKCKE